MATKTKRKTKISGQAVMGEMKTLALFTGGVVIGSMGGKLIDKVLKVDPTAQGFNIKAMARPVVLLGAGTAGNLLLKDANLKLVAAGVGASGMLSGVKVLLKKDLLAGLADFSFSGNGMGEASIFREPVNLSIQSYNPDLPVLSSPTAYNTEDLGSPDTDADSDIAFVEIL
jgi:F0F1-type ATP synthase assembly protein I